MIFCLVLILFSSGCKTKIFSKTPWPDGPVAHFPKMVVGDSWVLTGWSQKYGTDTYRLEIIELNSDGTFVTKMRSKKGGRTQLLYYDNKGQLIKILYTDSRKTIKPSTPPSKELDFPLFIGKKWSQKVYSISLDGNYYRYEYSYAVKGHEMVDTKAGSFMAFKILKERFNLDTGLTGNREYWYSPKAKIIVKDAPSWRRGHELMSYQLISADTSPPTIVIISPIMERGIAIVKAVKQVEIQGIVTDDRGVKWLKVNHSEVQLNEMGEFSYIASLSEGANLFELKASDAYGNKTKITVTVKYDPDQK